MHRWLGRRAPHTSRALWGLVVAAAVILALAVSGYEKRQSPSSPAAPGAARTTAAGAHAEGAASTSLLMRRGPPPEEVAAPGGGAGAGAGATATVAGPAVVHHGPMETPPVVAPATPAAPETMDEQDASAMDDDDDDDDSHELFAEELKEDDDDDETSTTTSSSSMTVAECAASYGKRHFLREDQRTAPPILYSFPGSGNTWTRLLIDFATGIYSGTVFARERAGEKLPGQGHCHKRVSVIKAHPQHFSSKSLFTVPDDNPYLARCRHKGGIDTFDRFILLTRNPYDAIWSEYRRKTSTVMRRDDFDAAKFEAAALRMAYMYKDSVKNFREVRRALPRESLFNIQYEDMLDEDMRVRILERLVDFVGLNDDATRQERKRRVLCAFELAQDVGGGRRGSSLVKTIEADDPNPVVTTADAYPRKLACAMWSVFGEAVKGTYTLPNGIAESECE